MEFILNSLIIIMPSKNNKVRARLVDKVSFIVPSNGWTKAIRGSRKTSFYVV